MSLLQTFDGETPEILKPSAFTPYDPSFPETVLVMFRRKTLDCLLEQVDAEVVCHVNAGVLLPVYRFAYRGKPMAAYLTVLGGPATGCWRKSSPAGQGKSCCSVPAACWTDRWLRGI